MTYNFKIEIQKVKNDNFRDRGFKITMWDKLDDIYRMRQIDFFLNTTIGVLQRYEHTFFVDKFFASGSNSILSNTTNVGLGYKDQVFEYLTCKFDEFFVPPRVENLPQNDS